MKPIERKSSIEFSSKSVMIIVLLLIFLLVLFFTVTHYKNQLNKNKKTTSNEEHVDTTFKLTYDENKECLSYLDNLKDINYNALNVSNYKDTIILYNTIYESCENGECSNEKKEIERHYIACLSNIKYSNDEEEYEIKDALEKNKITIEKLEKELNSNGLSKVIIKEEIKYDTTAPILDIGYVYINEGQTYTANRFIKSCTDDSNEECIISFTNEDMGKYTKAGTYDVEISAKDSSGNEVKKTTRLIIRGKTVVQKPSTPTNNTPTEPPKTPESQPSNPDQSTSGDGGKNDNGEGNENNSTSVAVLLPTNYVNNSSNNKNINNINKIDSLIT